MRQNFAFSVTACELFQRGESEFTPMRASGVVPRSRLIDSAKVFRSSSDVMKDSNASSCGPLARSGPGICQSGKLD